MLSRWRRPTEFVASLVVLGALLACGSSNTAAVITGDPPGDVTAGTGPVADTADATQRVLTQFLGLPATRQAGTPFVGTGDQPFVNLYLASDGPLPAGTRVTDRDPDSAVYELNAQYFLFWLDPDPLAQLGHLCYLLFVDARTGRIIATPAQFDPQIGTTKPLLFREDKAARIVYGHRMWFDELARDPEPLAGRQVLAGGQMAHGLHVSGSYEFSGMADINLVDDFMKDITGEDMPLDTLLDKKDDRIDEHVLAARLRDASAGLGEGDKFYFTLTTHASTGGKVWIGDDVLTWEQLCEILDQNVSAQYLNIIISACYSGKADTAFKKWDVKTDKGVHWFTATDDSHPSYADGDGSYGIRCAIKALKEALAGARADGTLTVGELEAAMANLGVTVTGDEIRKKICDKWKPINLAWWNDFEKDDGAGDKVRPQGDPKTGGFLPPQPPTTELPPGSQEFIEMWRQANLADDPVLLGPLFDPNYMFDGANHDTIIQRNPIVDTVGLNIVEIQHLNLAGVETYQFNLDLHRQVTGTNPIDSTLMGLKQLEVIPDPFRITAERLVFWQQQDIGGPNTLPLPTPPQFTEAQVDDLVITYNDPIVPYTTISMGGSLSVGGTITFTGLERQVGVGGGTLTNAVYASLAGMTVELARQGSTNVYGGTITAPTTPGRWVLSLSASSRNEDSQSGSFASSVAARSVEVRVTP